MQLIMLKNAPTLAIVAVDTAENGPSKVRQVTNKVCRNIGWCFFRTAGWLSLRTDDQDAHIRHEQIPARRADFSFAAGHSSVESFPTAAGAALTQRIRARRKELRLDDVLLPCFK